MPVKAVLFDMFDTLMLIEKNHEFYSPALQKMYGYLKENGVNVPFETFNAAYTEARDRILAQANLNLEEPHFNVRVSEALKNLGYDYDVSSSLVSEATGAFCNQFIAYVSIDKQAEPMLKGLHGKYKLGIVSNFAIPECVYKLLKDSGLGRFFDVVVVSGAVNKRKPSPDIFAHALEKLGVSATEAVFVGDTIDADVEGAKVVGMKSVYLERRVQKQTENGVPDVTIKSLGELPSALNRF